MTELWRSDDLRAWHDALVRYPDVISRQGVSRLEFLDSWYRDELPRAIGERSPAHVNSAELQRITEWKMARGVWRQRNLVLVRSNAPDVVEAVSRDAFARVDDDLVPIRILATLAGVGPATASAVIAAVAPDSYPFFDDLVAAQIPGFGDVDFGLKQYGRYRDALRERAGRLGTNWHATMVERALWAANGGKAGRPVGVEA